MAYSCLTSDLLLGDADSLMNRTILNPQVAKPLALLVSAVMQQYEAKFGKLDLGVPVRPEPEMKPPANEHEAPRCEIRPDD
jgi:hypothetical protein